MGQDRRNDVQGGLCAVPDESFRMVEDGRRGGKDNDQGPWAAVSGRARPRQLRRPSARWEARTPWCSRTTRCRVAVLCDHRQVLVSCGAQVLKYYCTRMFSRHHVGWMNNIGSILLFELI